MSPHAATAALTTSEPATNASLRVFAGSVPRDSAVSTAGLTERLYVRPHHLDLGTEQANGDSCRGTVRHINSAGPFVKVELESPWGEAVQVYLTQSRFSELAIRKGMELFMHPRETMVFPEKAG